MADNKLSNSEKKDLAKKLFVMDAYSQKEIAAKVGVSEQTMVKWVKEEQWDSLRKSLTTTKSEQLAFLYDILAKMTAEGKKALEDDDPDTNPDADGIVKISKAIQHLEKETNIGEMLQTGMLFLKFMKNEDLTLAKQFNHYFMLFIQEQMSKSK